MDFTGKTIGEIVAENYRAALVFRKYKIDFCCNGNRSLEEACANKKINSAEVLRELEQATAAKNTEGIDFKSWPADLLIDYIEKKHHRYVQESIPVLQKYLDKLCKVHGPAHPELFSIAQLFNESAGELTAHMKKEELVLFPYIRKMVKNKMTGAETEPPHFGTVQNPVQMMMHEHSTEGERFRRIAALSDNYLPPVDACSTYRVTFKLLQEFELDLHEHIHLENNILFPSAVQMENEMQAVAM